MKKRLISIMLTLAMVITLVPVTPVTVVQAAATTIKIGDYVQMGKYYGEPILWRCVDIDANGPLILADKILTIKPFDALGSHKYMDGTKQADPKGSRASYGGSDLWLTSNMRSWLNSTASAGSVKWLDGCAPTQDKVAGGNNDYAKEKGFLAGGNFSAGDRSVMKSVNQKSLLNPMDTSKLSMGGNVGHTYSYDISTIVQNYDTAYYHNATDKMFLLDVKQVNRVYQNSNTLGANYYIGKPTQKAVDNSDYKYSELSAINDWYYWLRSPYANSSYGYYVRRVGNGGANNSAALESHLGVRPAFYLDLQSAIFKSGNGSKGSPFSLNPEIHVKSVKLNKTSVSILKGKTSKLIPIINPSNASNKKVTWKSSNVKIASVSSTGMMKGIKKGIAYITIVTMDGKKSARCKVVVK